MDSVRAKAKSTILILGFLFLAACGGGGGGGSGGSGGSSAPAWVGTWLIQTENGTDISSLEATYTISESSVAFVLPGVCAYTTNLTVTGNNYTSVIQTTDCAGTAVGDVGKGTYSVSGNALTITSTTGGFTQVCIKISS